MAAIAIPRLDNSYFFHQLAQADRGVLVLDYDSALIRFGSVRKNRFPYPTLFEMLDSILSTTRTRIIIVSKQGTRDLVRILGVVADPSLWDSDNLQLITLNGNYHQCTPLSLLSNLCAVGPLAYLAGRTPSQPSATAVQPQFFLGENQTWVGATEDVLQFLIDWLRACGGEVC